MISRNEGVQAPSAEQAASVAAATAAALRSSALPSDVPDEKHPFQKLMEHCVKNNLKCVADVGDKQEAEG